MTKYKYNFGWGDAYEYEPSKTEIRNAIKELLVENASSDLHSTKGMVLSTRDLTIIDMTIESFIDNIEVENLKELYEHELHDFFEDKAKEEYEEGCEVVLDETSWYGTKQNVIGF